MQNFKVYQCTIRYSYYRTRTYHTRSGTLIFCTRTRSGISGIPEGLWKDVCSMYIVCLYVRILIQRKIHMREMKVKISKNITKKNNWAFSCKCIHGKMCVYVKFALDFAWVLCSVIGISNLWRQPAARQLAIQ